MKSNSKKYLVIALICVVIVVCALVIFFVMQNNSSKNLVEISDSQHPTEIVEGTQETNNNSSTSVNNEAQGSINEGESSMDGNAQQVSLGSVEVSIPSSLEYYTTDSYFGEGYDLTVSLDSEKSESLSVTPNFKKYFMAYRVCSEESSGEVLFSELETYFKTSHADEVRDIEIDNHRGFLMNTSSSALRAYVSL